MERRLLTPAEAALLVAPHARSATRCVQAGLLSLVGAGRIVFESPSGVSGPTLVLVPNPPDTVVAMPRHIRAVEQALLGYGKGRRLASTQVVHALQRAFGHGYARYVHEHVAASLVERGMLARKDDRWLGLFPRIRYERTSQGAALVIPLERLVTSLDRLPSLLKTDPDRALRLARSAGVLLIMAPDARRHVAALRELLASRGDVSVSLPYVPLEQERESRIEMWLDLGDMALTFDVGTLLDVTWSVEDFTGGSDGGSSDGGDGGGGD